MTGRDGASRLADVPRGDHTVAVWHDRLGTQEWRVTVAPRATASTTFTYTSTR